MPSAALHDPGTSIDASIDYTLTTFAEKSRTGLLPLIWAGIACPRNMEMRGVVNGRPAAWEEKGRGLEKEFRSPVVFRERG